VLNQSVHFIHRDAFFLGEGGTLEGLSGKLSVLRLVDEAEGVFIKVVVPLLSSAKRTGTKASTLLIFSWSREEEGVVAANMAKVIERGNNVTVTEDLCVVAISACVTEGWL
jgi:hypothetical protein